MMNKQVKVTFAPGEVVEGTVVDMNAAANVLYVENDVDTYQVNIETATVEVATPAAEQKEAASMVLMTVKELCEEIGTPVKYAEESFLQVRVVDYSDDETAEYEIEVFTKIDDDEEFYTLEIAGNNKDAKKRANAIKRELGKKFAKVAKEVIEGPGM
jgi:disulfide oxidoreductase YuzD